SYQWKLIPEDLVKVNDDGSILLSIYFEEMCPIILFTVNFPVTPPPGPYNPGYDPGDDTPSGPVIPPVQPTTPPGIVTQP
ncbi:MAG: hypothetical protein Q4E99_03815, partial [Bacillota bacterium]|nr:hypothetical protein [Bacillota bacterium]